MKRHLQTPEAQPLPVQMLSVEEEAILTDEHNEASQALDQATADADRITEVAEVATDAVHVVDITPVVGQVEAELVEAVGDMAVAGTDADPTDVISMPAPIEGAEPKPEGLSVEGIASTLKSIWDSIVTAIKNMWVGLKHWLTTYFSTLEQNKKHAEKLIERLSGMKGFVADDNKEIHMSDILGYGSYSKTVNGLLGNASKEDDKFMNYVVDTASHQTGFMVALGEEVNRAYQSYDGADSSKIVTAIERISSKMSNYLNSLGIKGKEKGEMCSEKIANLQVFAKGYSMATDASENSPETKIAYLSKIRFSVEQSTEFNTSRSIAYKVDVTPDMLLAKVKDRLEFIKVLMTIQNEDFKKLEEQTNAVEKSCSDMLTRIKEDNKAGQAFAKRLMPLTTAYANWATQPIAKLLAVSARHNKYWLSFFEMVTNNFKEA